MSSLLPFSSAPPAPLRLSGPEIEPLAVGTARIAIGAAAARGDRARWRPLPARRRGPPAGPALGRSAWPPTRPPSSRPSTTPVWRSARWWRSARRPSFTGLLARAFTGERLERALGARHGARLRRRLHCSCWAAARAARSRCPGVGLALLAGAGYGGYAVAGKTHAWTRAPRRRALMAAVFAIGAVLLLPLLALVPRRRAASTGRDWCSRCISAPCPTALAYILFARGLERIGAGETATLTLAEPVTAAALGFVVLGRAPGRRGGRRRGPRARRSGCCSRCARAAPRARAPDPPKRPPDPLLAAEIAGRLTRTMAQPKTAEHAASEAAPEAPAKSDAKPQRKRITRRKAVEQHVRSYFEAMDRRDVEAAVAPLARGRRRRHGARGRPARPRRDARSTSSRVFAATPDAEHDRHPRWSPASRAVRSSGASRARSTARRTWASSPPASTSRFAGSTCSSSRTARSSATPATSTVPRSPARSGCCRRTARARIAR